MTLLEECTWLLTNCLPRPAIWGRPREGRACWISQDREHRWHGIEVEPGMEGGLTVRTYLQRGMTMQPCLSVPQAAQTVGRLLHQERKVLP